VVVEGAMIHKEMAVVTAARQERSGRNGEAVERGSCAVERGIGRMRAWLGGEPIFGKNNAAGRQAATVSVLRRKALHGRGGWDAFIRDLFI
jgi:hypothetical protein